MIEGFNPGVVLSDSYRYNEFDLEWLAEGLEDAKHGSELFPGQPLPPLQKRGTALAFF